MGVFIYVCTLSLKMNTCHCYYLYLKVKLATLVKGDLKAPFSIATTLRRRGGHYTIWDSSNAGALGNVEYPSIAITPRSTLAQVVATDRVLSMARVELNCVLMLNLIAWNRTVFDIETVLTLNWIVWLRIVWLNWIAWNRNVFDN